MATGIGIVNRPLSPHFRELLERSLVEPCHTTGPGLVLATLKGVREENQDRALAVHVRRSSPEPSEFLVAALSDGMGGMVDGGGAANITLAEFVAAIVEDFDGDLDRLEDAAESANLAVFERYRGEGGATLVAAIFCATGDVFVAHCGDSRLYALSPDQPIALLTRDDTVAGLDAGADLESEMDNRLLNFVGRGARFMPTLSKRKARPGATWLLSSDGAHLIGRREIEWVLYAGRDVADVADRMMSASEAAGASDNATVIVVRPEEVFRDRSESETVCQRSGQGRWCGPRALRSICLEVR